MSSSLPRTPISVAVSAAEKEAGRLTQRNLEIATRALVRDGPVVLGDMVDHAVLDRLNEKMVKDAYELHSRKESPHARSQLFRLPTDNLQGPLVTQVTPTTLGSYPSPCFISGNTALPPTPSSPPASQPTYTDADFDHPSIPSLVINTPLVTMTPGNGATETRLGMHSDTTIADQEGLHCERASGCIKKGLLERRRGDRGPCQPVIRKGSAGFEAVTWGEAEFGGCAAGHACYEFGFLKARRIA